MQQISIKAPAKINLALDVGGLRSDGYHDICTVMQTIDLHDQLDLVIKPGQGQIQIKGDGRLMPLDESNICHSAARAWMQASGRTFSLTIRINKQIPSQAGLGGGSADAAAVLRGLNSLHDQLLTEEQLERLAATIGADVAFCLRGGLALCRGIGDQISRLKALPRRPLLLLKPSFGLATGQVYQKIDQLKDLNRSDYDAILTAIDRSNWQELAAAANNNMEQAAFALKRELVTYKELLGRTKQIMLLMSGSGTCFYAVYENEQLQEEAYNLLADQLPQGASLIKSASRPQLSLE